MASTVCSQDLVVMLEGCPRCGEAHSMNVLAKPLKKPTDGFTHWTMCPTNGEPVWVRISATVSAVA